MPRIGPRIRNLRNRRQLTIRTLSARSGVSHSTLSLIERDRVSPSLDTLAAILDALGSTLVGFFADGVQTPQSPFYRAADMPEIGNESGISYKIIGMNYPGRLLQVLKESYAVGADTGAQLSHEAQEAGCILSGEVEVTVGGRAAVLTAGDGYYFDSRQEHRFRNAGTGPATIVSAITPPSY